MSAKKRIVYPNLEAEIAGHGIRKYKIAENLEITPRTLSKKLSGEVRFTVEEAIQIQEQWFSNLPINELFRRAKES
ncbi:MAG: XRE family transcriptional regulator [Oscillospiraceae bacterium]|nr:XRE family transcriptional regulator [Oscillospiraceae bacterium]